MASGTSGCAAGSLVSRPRAVNIAVCISLQASISASLSLPPLGAAAGLGYMVSCGAARRGAAWCGLVRCVGGAPLCPGGAELLASHCLPARGLSAAAFAHPLTRSNPPAAAAAPSPRPPRAMRQPLGQDASRLAMRIVANYGLSDLGITTYAPVPPGLGFMQKSFEVGGRAGG